MEHIKVTFYRDSFDKFIIKMDDSVVQVDNSDLVTIAVGGMVTVMIKPNETADEESNPTA